MNKTFTLKISDGGFEIKAGEELFLSLEDNDIVKAEFKRLSATTVFDNEGNITITACSGIVPTLTETNLLACEIDVRKIKSIYKKSFQLLFFNYCF